MNEKLVLKNHLRKARNEKGLSQMELANMVQDRQSHLLKMDNLILLLNWHSFYVLH